MLFLLFHIGKDCYALDASQVVEVLPHMEIRAIPQAHRGVAGIFNYRGTLAPVIDLSELVMGQPAAKKLGTRIILINYPDKNGEKRPLGLIAERATETMKRDGKDFAAPGVTNKATPYLGPVVQDERGLIQWVEVDKLLSDSLRDSLFQQTAANA